MYDNQFIKALKSNCNKNLSFIDEVANVLDINYDASYRRINGRTHISLEDGIKLAKHFNVSLNELYRIGDQDRIMVTKTQRINSAASLIAYFKKVNNHLKPLEHNDKARMYYSARELPIFYYLKDPLLLRFKLFVWLQILDKNKSYKKIKFEEYKFPAELIETTLLTGKKYEKIRITEMWSSGILNSELNQIRYFFETKLLSYKMAVRICNQLRETIKKIEESTDTGKRESKVPFRLYHNELTTLNNTVLLKTKNRKILFVPHTLLNFYRVDDQRFCDEMDDFLEDQRFISKQITHSGIKDIILFFKPKYDQIDKLLKWLDLMNRFPIH